MTVITKYHGDTVTVHLQLTHIADNASDNMRPQKGRGKNKANRFLPHRQLRKALAVFGGNTKRFLPHRQLRNRQTANQNGTGGFLPHRQLRKPA